MINRHCYKSTWFSSFSPYFILHKSVSWLGSTWRGTAIGSPWFHHYDKKLPIWLSKLNVYKCRKMSFSQKSIHCTLFQYEDFWMNMLQAELGCTWDCFMMLTPNKLANSFPGLQEFFLHDICTCFAVANSPNATAAIIQCRFKFIEWAQTHHKAPATLWSITVQLFWVNSIESDAVMTDDPRLLLTSWLFLNGKQMAMSCQHSSLYPLQEKLEWSSLNAAQEWMIHG